jgi:LysR family glycine cleavage system transcriptional activator
LNSLLFFSTAARSLSFTLAAEELFVTRSAVSRQIKGLEDYLGVNLFDRTNTGLELTPEGLRYSNALSLIFSDIRNATNMVLGQEDEKKLKLGLSSTFNATWLMQRLNRFYTEHPNLPVAFVTNAVDVINEAVDLGSDTMDAVIRLGSGQWEGYHADKLLDVYVQPVCAPELLARQKQGGLAGLAEHNWLHYKHLPDLWSQWLGEAGASGLQSSQLNHELDNVAVAVQAAVDGLGIIPMYRPLADPLLESGTLVVAHDYMMLKSESYYFVCPSDYASHPPIDDFRTWLLAEAKEFRSQWSE